MKVKLLASSPEPEKIVAAAAKLCYANGSIDGIMDGLDDESAAGFIDMLLGMGHESPVEHASFTFGVEGVSRSLLAQLTRHRIASYSVQSQRYVKAGGFEYVTPPEITADPTALARFEDAMAKAQEAYDEIAAILAGKHLAELRANGESGKKAESKAEKMAIEDARFVLPNAAATKIVFTMNSRSLYNFFAHRLCSRAQWEIRGLADMMLAELKLAAPALFRRVGPPCAFGPCPEGKMSCGKSGEMRAKYAEGEI